MSNQRRRWFQFHLSTAIILMFMAGGLIRANVKPRFNSESPFYYQFKSFASSPAKIVEAAQGFPFDFCERNLGSKDASWSAELLVFDAGIAILLLALVAAICESTLRLAIRLQLFPTSIGALQFVVAGLLLVNLMNSEADLRTRTMGWPWQFRLGQDAFSMKVSNQSAWPAVIADCVAGSLILLVLGPVVYGFMRYWPERGGPPDKQSQS